MNERAETERIVIDNAPGERRVARLQGGRVVGLDLVRASWPGRRAMLGDVAAARVARLDPDRRGAFLQVEPGDVDVFLPVEPDGRGKGAREADPPLTEGARVHVRITREAARDKAAVAALHGAGDRAPVRPAWRAPPDDAAAFDPEARALCDAAFEAALETSVRVPGGGRLRIEPTAALVAVDVDAADRPPARGDDDFAVSLNGAAADEASRQLGLRRLGGLVVVDFLAMGERGAWTALRRRLAEGLKRVDRRARLAPETAFGLVTASLPQTLSPLHELLCDAHGGPTAETEALAGLRRLESEGAADRAARLVLTVSPDARLWLAAHDALWRPALTRRLGARFEVDEIVAPSAPSRPTRTPQVSRK